MLSHNCYQDLVRKVFCLRSINKRTFHIRKRSNTEGRGIKCNAYSYCIHFKIFYPCLSNTVTEAQRKQGTRLMNRAKDGDNI